MKELFGRPGRLDAVLAEELGIARADVQRAIERGRVLVDGTSRPKSHRLAGGELLQVDLEEPGDLSAEEGGVQVRYEDEHLAIVVKPAGIVTHPTAARREGTLVNLLLGMGMRLAGPDPDRPGIVHRLDVGTSGLLLIAKTDEAHAGLVALLRAREVEREYSALVRGRVEHDRFTVEAPLGRRGARVVIRRGSGVSASTDAEVIERFAAASLLSVRPRTGRTHQIRVHLAALGHPVLGDRVYGGGGGEAARLGLTRPFLHARRLALTHPLTRKRIEAEEPLPDDLQRAVERARQD